MEDKISSPYEPDLYPIQRIGFASHKALWVLDKDAAAQLLAMQHQS